MKAGAAGSGQSKGQGFRIGKVICILLTVSLIAGAVSPVSAAPGSDSWNEAAISDLVRDTAAWLQKTVADPMISTVGGEWTIIGLCRCGALVPQSYYDLYYGNVASELKEKQGKLTSTKYTEYSRLILALTAAGRDVTRVEGYNLLEGLADYNQVIKQGINGPIFALIALDSHDYAIPELSGAQALTTRQKLIDYILSREVVSAEGTRGGFALTGDIPDPDLTGMALQALARYQNQPAVKAATDRALTAISKQQLGNGGFSRWGSEDSETLAQMITGLCALGIDPATDQRFLKTDAAGRSSSMIDALLTYQVSGGGFEHTRNSGINLMAAEQSLYALTAYDRLLKGKTALYDMRDVSIDGIKVLLNGATLTFDQPPVNIDGRVLAPLRGIFEAMGADIVWDPISMTVTAAKGNRIIVLAIGSKTAYVDGKPVSLDVPGRIINGRTLVPVRFISESLDADVGWVRETKTVVITK